MLTTDCAFRLRTTDCKQLISQHCMNVLLAPCKTSRVPHALDSQQPAVTLQLDDALVSSSKPGDALVASTHVHLQFMTQTEHLLCVCLLTLCQPGQP